MEILCNDGIPLLSINGDIDSNNDYLQSYPTFMTDVKQGKIDNTYLVIESYRLPFKITNILGIVSKKNLIVIDKNSVFGQKLYKKFRLGSYTDLNYLYLDFNTLTNFDNTYVKGRDLSSIVFVTDYNRDINFPIEDLSPRTYVVKIEEITPNYGIIHYQTQENIESEYIYYEYDKDLSLQTMAVFSSPDVFSCSYETLFKSTEAVYNFYIEKSEYFSNSPQKVCVDSFELADQRYQYNEIRSTMQNISLELKTNKFINARDLENNINLLKEQNLRLEENSCPYIY